MALGREGGKGGREVDITFFVRLLIGPGEEYRGAKGGYSCYIIK